eukprot:TRINITY_DN1848_c0_g1_i8.p1 TRINITY_DN1848_c0_g1~~TRINITY_DN1848_c0_g1_i8.p1  ORF type:complete len:1171 (+),score=220.06 TRINITY_DN1848_c0_g1_i8:257-3769(+)
MMMISMLRFRSQPLALLGRVSFGAKAGSRMLSAKALGGPGVGGAAGRGQSASEKPQPVVEIPYKDLAEMTPEVVQLLRKAFVGPKAYGAVAITNIPGYAQLRRKAFRAGIDLALLDSDGRQRAAAVNNTYPGWSGTPGSETHPLQSSMLFNVKEVIPNGKVDPFFGKNIFPSEEYKNTWVSFSTHMHNIAMEVVRGCDRVLEEDVADWASHGRSLGRLADEGPALAGRFICYDSGFTREDRLMDDRDKAEDVVEQLSEIAPVKSAGHAADGLASMRTHSTPVKSAGHAGDGLASMRTHSTPVKSAGHAGDGLASMRTHSTPVKSAGHAGDGLASMRTHSTPVKSAGHAGDGLASMRTHSTPVKSAGHAGDGLASMRTHSTPVKSAGHAGDGLASMRTHSTPVKSAGHAGDGLASMRTHSTPVKSAGHAGDGLASMRTHSTPVKSAGHAGDGLASMRTHSTPVKSAGHSADGRAMSPLSSQYRTTLGSSASMQVAQISTSLQTVDQDDYPGLVADEFLEAEPEAGDYWLPWHIDSNFVTVLHKEMYVRESDASLVPEPEGSGLLMMNKVGDVVKFECSDEDALVLQMGAFGQIYSGGQLTACRHAVLSPRPPGTARFNFCNFWYVPWETVCDTPRGYERQAINTGWNAMMDDSYLNITMRQSFWAFRKFMTSPEARVQFADSVQFKELSEMLPLFQSKAGGSQPQIQVDLITDVRCPFSLISQSNLEAAVANLSMNAQVELRFHPLFLNPNVAKEGESLDDYLWREYGYTKEFAHSEDYPLRKAAVQAGINLNPHRRVVNTFDAFCLVEAAQAMQLQQRLVQVLSRRYFEEAEDISDEQVLVAAAVECGMCGKEALEKIKSLEVRARVQGRYDQLSARLGEVPHFLLRERISGNGLEVGGMRSVQEWEDLLQRVLEKSRFVGMSIPGMHGKEVFLPEANPHAPVSLAYNAQHGWSPTTWPYQDDDFSRMDETPDGNMYAEARLVEHLDESSLERLTGAYRSIMKAAPDGFSVLDLCGSWNSHFPEELIGHASRVVVHGLNVKELEANLQATEQHVQDLNECSQLPWNADSFDLITLALSVQYLTDPRKVFSEMHRVLKPGGMAVVAYSHRCFLEKSVRVWADATDDGEGHAHLICRYFQHGPQGGWEKLSTVDVSPQHGDPLWLVLAVKPR